MKRFRWLDSTLAVGRAFLPWPTAYRYLEKEDEKCKHLM